MRKKLAVSAMAGIFTLITLCSLLPAQVFAASLSSDLRSIWLTDGGKGYYYNQLSDAHKAAWETDIDNILAYPEVPHDFGYDVPADYKYQALDRMIPADNPKIFWLDWINYRARLCYFINDPEEKFAPIWPEGVTLDKLKTTFLNALESDKAAIANMFPANPTEKEMAKEIAIWICNNNTYNYAQTSNHKADSDPVKFEYLAAHSAYSAIVPGDEFEPVCEGYSYAFKLLCNEFGINCICVGGTSSHISGGGGHMWNYVQIDGKWYLVDLTNVDNDTDDPSLYNYSMFFMNNDDESSYTLDPYLGSGVRPGSGCEDGDWAEFSFPELYRIPCPEYITAVETDSDKAELSGDEKNGYVITAYENELPAYVNLDFDFLPADGNWEAAEWTTVNQYYIIDNSSDSNIEFTRYEPLTGRKNELRITAKKGTAVGDHIYQFRAYDPDGNQHRQCFVNVTVRILEARAETEPEFALKSLVLSDRIGVNFFMDLDGLTEAEKQISYMQFKVNNRTTTVSYDPEFKNETGEYYGFTCPLNSVQMADEIEAVFFYGGGKTVSTTYSVADYVKYINENSRLFSEKTVNLVNALADFGHYVQPILSETNGWSIGTDHAEMSGRTVYTADSVSAAKSGAERYKFEIQLPDDSAITGLTYALELETKTAIRIFVTVEKGSDISATVDGSSVPCVRQSDGRYCIEIGDISAHELADGHTVIITSGGDSVSITNLSALSYVNTVLSSPDSTESASYAAASLYNYYIAAIDYRS